MVVERYDAGDILKKIYSNGNGGESTHELHQIQNHCMGQRYYIYGTCRCPGNGWGCDNIAILMAVEMVAEMENEKSFFNGIDGSGRVPMPDHRTLAAIY